MDPLRKEINPHMPTTTTTATLSKLSETKIPLPTDDVDTARSLTETQSSQSNLSFSCETPVPVQFDANSGSICPHLKWQNACASCHDLQLSTVAHLAEVTTNLPVLHSAEKCPHSVLPEVSQIRLTDLPEIGPNTGTSDSDNSQAGPSTATFFTPEVTYPISLQQRPSNFPFSFIPNCPPSPDNLKNSFGPPQASHIYEECSQNQELVGSQSAHTFIPVLPSDLVSIPRANFPQIQPPSQACSHHEPYCEHYHSYPQCVIVGRRSRSPSTARSRPSIIQVPSSFSGVEHSRSRSRERAPSSIPIPPVVSPFALPLPHDLSPLRVLGQDGDEVRDSKHSSHSTIPFYRPLSPSFHYHEKFFIEDGTVVFRVGTTLYKIHRHFFDMHSDFFHDLFAGLKSTQQYVYEPIVLSDVKTEDFDRLLTIFYPTHFTIPDLTTVDEWTSILVLATEWVFSDARALAIKHLTPMISSIDKVILGTKYDVHDWIAPGIKELVVRERPLDLAEGARLGSAMVVKIGQLRSGLGSGFDGTKTEDYVLLRVKEAFDV